MEIKYNAEGVDRKALVNAVSMIIGEPAKYLGAPTFAYSVTDRYTITRDGNLDIFDRADSEEVERLIEELAERGFIAEGAENADDTVEVVIIGKEPDEEDEPVGFSIGMSISELSDKPCTEKTLENLRAVIASKRTLFQKALSTGMKLEIEWESDTIWFDWFDRRIAGSELEIYTPFIKALYKFAENAVRVTEREKPIENEKFTMRTFLNRIGLSGAEYKTLRKALMKNLSGNSAFRYGRKS